MNRARMGSRARCFLADSAGSVFNQSIGGVAINTRFKPLI
jgi:hypothetical protein